MPPISHLIKNPAGTFSVVGSVPETCLDVHTPPTISEVMGGRTFTRDGVTFGWKGRSFSTQEEARTAVLAGGASLCSCCSWA